MQLRFLLDEDTKKAVASPLSKTGHDVERVVEVDSLGRGSDDTNVMAYAKSTDRIIVTHDDDYVDPDLASEHRGVFFFPSQRRPPYEMFRIIRNATEAYPNREALPAVLYLTDEWI